LHWHIFSFTILPLLASAALAWSGGEKPAYSHPPVCEEALQGLSVDTPLSRLDRGLIVNLDHFNTPEDWRRVPGAMVAIKNFARRGKSVLADVDDDGELEVLGESRETSPEGHAIIACRRADGSELWRRELKSTNRDNNGAQCVDLDGDGVKELVIVGDTLCVYNARTGEEQWDRNILDKEFWHGKRFADKPLVIEGKRIQFCYPWRVGHCTDKQNYDIIVGACYRSGYPVGSSQGAQVACYRADGTLAWQYELDEPDYVGTVGHEIAVVDLDTDGLDETIFSQMGGVICLNADGSVRFRHDVGGHSDCIATDDFDGDGVLEVVVQQPGCGHKIGPFYFIDGATGDLQRVVPNKPPTHTQGFAFGRFFERTPKKQLALSSQSNDERYLRMIDERGRYVFFRHSADASDRSLLRLMRMSCYSAEARDFDGDGLDEILTMTTPKVGSGYQGDENADRVGMAIFRGDGALVFYWNFYRSAEDTRYWGFGHWDGMRYAWPNWDFDRDDDGRSEILLETPDWFLVMEIPDSE